ncbi:MAG: hypothetical protein ACKO2V_22895, partial [Snowella sp.]
MEAQVLLDKYFETAFSAPDGVKKLRELILSLAMQGKLVPQDPSDQPASELLKEIEAEKEKLIQEGKIKQQKPLPEIKENESWFELPSKWIWVRLGEISQLIGGFAYKSNYFLNEGNNQVLRLGNIRPNFLKLDSNPVYIDDQTAQKTLEYRLQKNDILITMTGTRNKRDYLYTCKIFQNPLLGKTLFLNQRVGVIRLYIYSDYLNKALDVD